MPSRGGARGAEMADVRRADLSALVAISNEATRVSAPILPRDGLGMAAAQFLPSHGRPVLVDWWAGNMKLQQFYASGFAWAPSRGFWGRLAERLVADVVFQAGVEAHGLAGVPLPTIQDAFSAKVAGGDVVQLHGVGDGTLGGRRERFRHLHDLLRRYQSQYGGP